MAKLLTILCVDLTTYPVYIIPSYHSVLKARMFYEQSVRDSKLGEDSHRGATSFSRGLLGIATQLRNAGHSIEFIVSAKDKPDDFWTEEAVNVDVVCISAVTPTIPMAAHICALCKSANREVMTVVGGPHTSVLPTQTLQQYPSIDYAVSGPGLTILPHLLRQYPERVTIPGVAVHQEQSGVRHASYNRSVSPKYLMRCPDYWLLQPNSTGKLRLDHFHHNLITQWGCPYRCAFCADRRTWHGNDSIRAMESTLSELVLLRESCDKGTLLHICDTVFNYSAEYANSLCRVLARFSDHFHFSIDTRSDLITSRFVEKAAEVGIRYFRLGVDPVLYGGHGTSTRPESLNIARSAFETIRRHAPQSIVHVYWMTGIPGSNKHSLEESSKLLVNLVSEELVDIVGNRILVPYPGTPYFDHSSRWGLRLLSKDWRRYDRLSPPVFDLDELSGQTIFEKFLEAESMLVEAYNRRLSQFKSPVTVEPDYVSENYLSL